MSFRARILFACLVAAVLPLLVFAAGTRREVRNRTAEQFAERSRAAAAAVEAELAARVRAIDSRLTGIAARIGDEPVVRAALAEDGPPAPLLDFAPRVMPAAGLDYLVVLDAHGVVRSAGHFRADHGRTFPQVGLVLDAASGAVVRGRTRDGTMIVLASAHAFRTAGVDLTLIGGVRIDDAFLTSLVRDESLATAVSLVHAAERAIREPTLSTGRLAMPWIDDVDGDDAPLAAHWRIAQSRAPLEALQRGLDRWLAAAIAAAILLALLVARVLAQRVSRPLDELARKSRRINLDRLDATFATRRSDEIGTLSRLLDEMVARLRAAAAELRVAERRATVGDMARQVNHDVRNGLLPIRNVMRHLDEVAAAAPAELPAVFAERATTLHSGIEYLETLAANYARLTPVAPHALCDVNATIRTVHDGGAGSEPRIRLHLSDAPLRVRGDPVALRRIVENLAVNAVDSLGEENGRVVVSTARAPAADGGQVIISIADDGCGIPAADIERVFGDFYTTKPDGSGLGLSIVRRLVADMGGRIRIESAVGRGTTVRIELPEAT